MSYQKSTIAELISEKLAGLDSIKDFANAIGVHPLTVAGWRDHTTTPSLANAEKILNEFGLELTVKKKSRK